MKNNECKIYIKTKKGKTQVFYKEKEKWIQKSSGGKFYFMTAEQVLSHILPQLVGLSQGKLEVKQKIR